MRLSRRARRMARHHRRHGRRYAFNLVSLMDIFTILVFFLLVNSAEVQTLPNPKELTLPQSLAETEGRESVVVMVSEQGIRIGNRHIVDLETVLDSEEQIIPELARALANPDLGGPGQEPLDPDAIAEREITIMADKNLPYRLLKKVMLSSTSADYGRISLAVMREGQG